MNCVSESTYILLPNFDAQNTQHHEGGGVQNYCFNYLRKDELEVLTRENRQREQRKATESRLSMACARAWV